MILSLCAIIYISPYISARISYKNFTLYQVKPVRSTDVIFFRTVYENNTFGWIFWSEHILKDWPISIVVLPDGRKDFETTLSQRKIDYKITINDLEREFREQQAVEHDRRNLESFDWNNYNTLDSINDWLTAIQKRYSNYASIVAVGKTYENRTIMGIRIANNLKAKKQIVIIEGGIHAREWISTSVATFVIKQLLEMKTVETVLARKAYDFYIFPILNPDGYFHTHTKDRMWRKNKNPYHPGIGVDLNRNFDSYWMAMGGSTDPYSITYSGPRPFSELETKSYAKTLQKLSGRIDLYIALHSFGQLILVPPIYSPKGDKYFLTAKNLGLQAADVLSKKYGTKYKVGKASEILYAVSGNSIDWARNKLNVTFAYAYELRDTGRFGFALPKNQILPTCIETTDSIMFLVNNDTLSKGRNSVSEIDIPNQVGRETSISSSCVLILLTHLFFDL